MPKVRLETADMLHTNPSVAAYLSLTPLWLCRYSILLEINKSPVVQMLKRSFAVTMRKVWVVCSWGATRSAEEYTWSTGLVSAERSAITGVCLQRCESLTVSCRTEDQVICDGRCSEEGRRHLGRTDRHDMEVSTQQVSRAVEQPGDTLDLHAR
jgi:hypothetical protein